MRNFHLSLAGLMAVVLSSVVSHGHDMGDAHDMTDSHDNMNSSQLTPPQDIECDHFTMGNTTSAGCNDYPGRVCSGKCVSTIIGTKCTLSGKPNDMGPNPTNQSCTIGYGKSSATMAICQSENATYTCYGPPVGTAKCKACVQHRDPDSSSPHHGPTTPGSDDMNKPDGSSTPGLPTTPTSPDGTPATKTGENSGSNDQPKSDANSLKYSSLMAIFLVPVVMFTL